MEPILICDRERVTVATMISCYGDSREKILRIVERAKGESFKYNGFTYKEQKSAERNPNDGVQKRKVVLTDVITRKDKAKDIKHYLNGKEMTIEEIATEIKVARYSLRIALRHIDKAILNGEEYHSILQLPLFTLHKGKDSYPGLTVTQCVEKLGICKNTIYKLTRDKEESREGWSITRDL